MPESTESLIRGIEGRIIRMETLLEGISNEMKKGDEKFRRLEQENAEIKGELAEIRQQLAYWKGGLAIIAVIWPLVIKYLF